MSYLILGLIFELVFISIMIFKTIIPTKIYWWCLFTSLLLAAIIPLFDDKKSFYLLIPFFFLVIYQFLRFIFKRIFGNEPILAGYWQRSWDQGEYRRLHFGDSVFTIALLFLPSILSGLLISTL